MSEALSRIEILRGQPDEAETVALVTAILALNRPQPVAELPAPLSPWRQTALREAQRNAPSPSVSAAPSLWPD